MNNDEELKNLQKRFRLLGYLMFPFTILFALGASAYFAGDAYLSFLENRSSAFTTFCIGLAGVIVFGVLAALVGWKQHKLISKHQEL